jgi:calcium-dependent protein kinase
MATTGVKKSLFVSASQGDIRTAYDLGKMLGDGAYGQVFIAKHRASNQERAIKKIPKSRIKHPDRLQTEIDVMKIADHPYIVKLFEVWEDDRYIYLVMECCSGGELFNHVIQKKRLSEREAAHLFRQLLNALNYLHQNNIVHRDLKPENVLFAGDPNQGAALKLCDFGLAKMCSNEGQKMMSKIGTPFYIAPEVIAGSGYGFSCDLWSCGVILYILLSGYPPFFGNTEARIFEKVRTGTYDFRRPEWNNVSEAAKDLIRNLLIVQPEGRFTMSQALEHPWIASNDTLPDTPLEINLTELQNFTNGSKLRKIVLLCVATQCSDSDIRNLREVFVKLDTNGDGTLNISELRTGIAHLPSVGSQIEEVMKEMDIDNSGRIDYSEFLASTIDKSIYMQEERLYAAFKIFDRDNSGKISAVELREILGKEGIAQNEEFWAQLIEESDTNHDGEIDFNEFLGLMSNKKLSEL